MIPDIVLAPGLLDQAGINAQKAQAEILKGGNNRVFKVWDDKRAVAVKQYFKDDRNRLDREAGFISLAWNSGIYTVPEPLFFDPVEQLAVYSFVDGGKLTQDGIRPGHLEEVIEFISRINRDDVRFSEQGRQILAATEACFFFEDHFLIVEKRMQQFQAADISDPEDRPGIEFMVREVGPVWERLKKQGEGRPPVKKQPGTRHCLISPSDFGFHNILNRKDGQGLAFIDFEYAGWDDPAKLICDFFCQVAVPVPSAWFNPFTAAVRELVEAGPEFETDLALLMKVCRVKWCCIMLNVFLHAGKQRKKFAGYDADIRELQLEKARKYAQAYLF